mgnify:CR=1 FL=1
MNQISFSLDGERPYLWGQIIEKDVIIDRGSRYSYVIFQIGYKEDVKTGIAKLKKDLFFAKATHNSYAWRLQTETGIVDGKNDDGETGAGMCILREIQRAERVNLCVVVTRYFWGIQLQADRFKHVIDTTKKALAKIKSS